jgi:hypothetical protein
LLGPPQGCASRKAPWPPRTWVCWGTPARVRFITDLARGDSPVLKLLQRVDKRFERKPGQTETAINDKGFALD